MAEAGARYAVRFTPVGWQVLDTREARDPVAEYGLGAEEYRRARERAASLNAAEAEALAGEEEWYSGRVEGGVG